MELSDPCRRVFNLTAYGAYCTMTALEGHFTILAVFCFAAGKEGQMNALFTRVLIINAGSTALMVGPHLRPSRIVRALLKGVGIPEGVQIKVIDMSYRPDSTNLKFRDRIRIGHMVEDLYQDYDVIIIIHGTDTLPESAAALCMIFKTSLQKPVIFVGFQMRREEDGSEFVFQMGNTLRVAQAFHEHKVVGVYNHCMFDVWDGSRLLKRTAKGYDAFHTPGRNPVAEVGRTIELKEGVRYQDPQLLEAGLQSDYCFSLGIELYMPSADRTPLSMIYPIKVGWTKGILLVCKGAGQIPDRKWKFKNHSSSWMDAVGFARYKRVPVVIVSPFDEESPDLRAYELGHQAWMLGARSAGDLTWPMAEAKTAQGVLKFPDDPDRLEEYLQMNHVGEHLLKKPELIGIAQQ